VRRKEIAAVQQEGGARERLESRGGIGDPWPAKQLKQVAKQVATEAPSRAHLITGGVDEARANRHVGLPALQPRQQPRNVRRIMLSVGIELYQARIPPTGRILVPGLQRCTVAEIEGMAYAPRAGSLSLLCGLVSGPIVHNDDIDMWHGLADAGDD